MNKQASLQATTNLTPAQEFLQELWEEHLGQEFVAHNSEDALATMVEDAHVNCVPVMTGGVGKPAVSGDRSELALKRTDRSRQRSQLNVRTIQTV